MDFIVRSFPLDDFAAHDFVLLAHIKADSKLQASQKAVGSSMGDFMRRHPGEWAVMVAQIIEDRDGVYTRTDGEHQWVFDVSHDHIYLADLEPGDVERKTAQRV